MHVRRNGIPCHFSELNMAEILKTLLDIHRLEVAQYFSLTSTYMYMYGNMYMTVWLM